MELLTGEIRLLHTTEIICKTQLLIKILNQGHSLSQESINQQDLMLERIEMSKRVKLNKRRTELNN